MVALTKYTQTEGLSSYYITRVLKDSYGFLWVGTQEGLDLFDTRHFLVYSPSSGQQHQLGGSFVIDMLEDVRRNMLWVLTAYGDICGIDLITRNVTRRIRNDDQGRPLSGYWLRSLALQGDTLWIAGLGQILGYQISRDQYLPVKMTEQAGLATGECNIAMMYVDEKSRLWLFSDGYGVVILDRSLHRESAIYRELSKGAGRNKKLRFWSLVRNRQFLYAGTSWGLKVFSPDAQWPQKNDYRPPGFTDSSEVLGLAVAQDGGLFYSTSQGVSSWSAVTGFRHIYRDQDQDDDWLSLTYQLYYDTSAQRLWLGTQSGLAVFGPGGNPFTAYSKSRSTATRIKHAYSLLPINEKMLYCGDENGLYTVDLPTRTIVKIGDMGSNLLLFQDVSHHVFLSNKSGFYIVQGRTVLPASRLIPGARSLESDQFNSAIQYNDSLILLGSVIQKGLTVWNTKSRTISVFHRDSLVHPLQGLSIINNLFRSSTGRAFVLTERSIIEFDPLTSHSVEHRLVDTATGTPLVNFMDMCEMQGRYYIGTYGQGLLVADSNFGIQHILTTQEGLSNNCVYKIFPYQDRTLLVTTNNGLSLIDVNTWQVRTYYQSDGLHSSLFEQVCGVQSGGKIYAGGVNGFTVIDPGKISDNPVAPGLYITRVNMQARDSDRDTSNLFLKELSVPNNILQVTVYISGLSYRNPARTRYEYKIGEAEEKWISTGGQNFINLPVLPPGAYTLYFRAGNESGVYSSPPVSLKLYFRPKWYQTVWYKISVILVCVFLFYLFYRYRLSQIHRQQAIRKEIAGDLHDDIGSVLNSVKIFAHLAQTEPENEKYFSHIEESLSQASYGLRDMIWVLDSTEDTLQELFDRIKKYAVPVCTAKAILFKASLKAESGKLLSKTVKRNLLLIAKEGINNSIKYARCSTIWLRLEQSRSGILLFLEDDGDGFDLSQPAEGNGLRNIRGRARQIQFSATINSAFGKGTSIEVREVSP